METEEQAAFRASCRRFAEEKIAPLVDAAEASGIYPQQLRRDAGAAGFLAVTAPERARDDHCLNRRRVQGDAVRFEVRDFDPHEGLSPVRVRL